MSTLDTAIFKSVTKASAYTSTRLASKALELSCLWSPALRLPRAYTCALRLAQEALHLLSLSQLHCGSTLSPHRDLQEAFPGSLTLPAPHLPVPTPKPLSSRCLLDFCVLAYHMGLPERAGVLCLARSSHSTMATYRCVHIQVLHLLLKPVHHCRHFLKIHGTQGLVQSFGHLCHILGHLG